MKFEEALAAMREGKCVRRPSFDPSVRFVACLDDNGNITDIGRIITINGKIVKAESVAFYFDQLIANDWEIVE